MISRLPWQILIPIKVRIKRAYYDHLDDSDIGDVTRFEDVTFVDLDTFTEQGTLNQ